MNPVNKPVMSAFDEIDTLSPVLFPDVSADDVLPALVR
jgi:hypothetical protein